MNKLLYPYRYILLYIHIDAEFILIRTCIGKFCDISVKMFNASVEGDFIILSAA